MKSRAPWAGARGDDADDNVNVHASHSISPHDLQVTDKSLTAGLARIVWWNQWREGNRLPAEAGVILLTGGRRD